MNIPTILENRTRRFRYGPRFFAVSFSLSLSHGQLFLSRFLEAGRINPSQIRWRSRKQFASLSPFLPFSSIVYQPLSDRSSCIVRTSNEPGCRVLGVSRWFSWRYPTAIFRTAVMCLPCLRLIRVLGITGPTIYTWVLGIRWKMLLQRARRKFSIIISTRDENSCVFRIFLESDMKKKTFS